MIGHYITIASRNSIKYKLQTLISIVGLAIGLVSFTYGMKWLEYETSYDGFYPKSEQIYTLYGSNKQTGKKERELPSILAQKLRQNFPEIKETTLISSGTSSVLFLEDKTMIFPKGKSVDEHFFTYFPRKVICGRQSGLLQDLNEIVITRSFALKYFGSPEDALGAIVENDSRQAIVVTAIIEDAPVNSSFQEELYELDKNKTWRTNMAEEQQWSQFDAGIYLILEDKANPGALGKKIQQFMVENDYLSILSVKMIPITDKRHTFGSELSFNLLYIRTFTVTTILLLLCVCFNFMNLLLNRIYLRSKEMKLRSAIGAGKSDLICLLLTELTLQVGIVFVVALCMQEVSATSFCQTFGLFTAQKEIMTSLVINALLCWGILVCILFPFFLYFVRTSSLLVTAEVTPIRKGLFRKISMTIQLGICVFFLMSVFIMGRQIALMKHKDLGFTKEGLIQIQMTLFTREAVSHDLVLSPFVEQMSPASLFSISHDPLTSNKVWWEGKQKDYAPNFQTIEVGEDFPGVFDIPILKGRFVNESDLINNGWRYECNAVVINEEAARIMGMNDPIGKKVNLWNGSVSPDGALGQKEVVIVGVIKNFQSASLHNPILPMILSLEPRKWESNYYYTRVKPENEQAAIKVIHEIFNKHREKGDSEPAIQSMNALLDQLNSSENASLQLFSLLAVLCTLISVFGLYSISSSNIAQRRKEVAVRKVMGASSKTIISMFFKEYLTVVLIANCVALPLAWLFMHGWLEQYSYRISIGFWMYGVVFLLTAALIICTVLYQTLKAAGTNPSIVIKSE